NGDLTFNSTSHVVSTNFFASARKWKFNFSDFFTMTSDFNTFNATHGGFSVPEDSRITVFPTGSSQSSHINSAQMQADYILNERSGLSFGGSHLHQDYPDTSLFQRIFSDQQRISGNVAYVRRTSEHSTWSLGCISSYLTFSQSESARVQGINLGHSRE